MKKIPTIFVRDWEGTLGPPARFVLDEPHPDCAWVFAGEGAPTRKLDGTCCLVRGGLLYKRHEVRPGNDTPEGFEAIETDEETGKTVGWVAVGDGPEDRWHREAWDATPDELRRDGTYELIGPKIQGNPEQAEVHTLIPHTVMALRAADPPRTFDGLREWLTATDVEGIVFHHPDGRMAKIKGKDFGIKRKAAS